MKEPNRPFGETEAAFQRDPLPTTPEIARIGVDDFREVVDHLPERRVRMKFLNDTRIQTLFTGLTPEIKDVLVKDHYIYWHGNNWNDYYREDYSNLKRVMKDVPITKFLFLPMPGYDTETKSYYVNYSVTNVFAATHVMQLHIDYFPMQAAENPVDWLKLHQYLDRQNDRMSRIQYALLSGYPVRAAEEYADAIDTIGNVRKFSRVWGSGRWFRSADAPRDVAFLQSGEQLLEESGMKRAVDELRSQEDRMADE